MIGGYALLYYYAVCVYVGFLYAMEQNKLNLLQDHVEF